MLLVWGFQFVCLNPTIADICHLEVKGARETFSVLKIIALQKRKLISTKNSFDVLMFSSVKGFKNSVRLIQKLARTKYNVESISSLDLWSKLM